MGAPELGRSLLKMFSILLLSTPLALALPQAPGIPLERQLPVESRQGWNSGYGEEERNFEPDNQACNETEINCNAGFDSMGCSYGNYCIQKVNEYDGCSGVCGQICNYETEDWCDMGNDSTGCWLGNWCQDKSEGGCPVPQYGSEMASGYGLSEGATVMERAGKNSGFKSHALGGRDAEYYSAKSFRAQLANLHNTMERAGKTGKSKLKQGLYVIWMGDATMS